MLEGGCGRGQGPRRLRGRVPRHREHKGQDRAEYGAECAGISTSRGTTTISKMLKERLSRSATSVTAFRGKGLTMDYLKLSKEVSYALRHAPWEYELELDEKGFVPVAQLLAALNEGGGYSRDVTVEDLGAIIHNSDKKRHEIIGDRIRAIYGHSTPGKVNYDSSIPPAVLYHGTARRFVDRIITEGLKPMSRQYVHLSTDVDTAVRVGSRKDSSPALFMIDAKSASVAGFDFYRGNDKVWLANEVPPKYLRLME